MKQVEFSNWLLVDERTGERRRSSWKMTREEAIARDAQATLCAGTSELRLLPESEAERAEALLRPHVPPEPARS